MNDNSELKRLAEAATPGKWEYEQDCLFFFLDGYTKHLMELCEGDDVDGIQQVENAKFIAAANPAVVLALIAENELLAKTADCWDRLNIQNKALSDSFRAERDQLKAENEALVSALNDILRVTPMGVEAFDIAALVLGELSGVATGKGGQS